MTSDIKQERAIELLRELGLKGYEAKCFVALSRLPHATAKEISEISDVPRTRVYDAIRVLEAKGLVEIQHSRPQQFRAVSIDEALRTLRGQYEARIRTLRNALSEVEPADDRREQTDGDVWSLSGSPAIANRTRQLIDDADDEILLIVGDDAAVTDRLVEALELRVDEGVRLSIGTVDEQTKVSVDDRLPHTSTFISELGWLDASEPAPTPELTLGMLVTVDGETVLASSIEPETNGHRAVVGQGSRNVLVTIIRRMMAAGFRDRSDCGQSSSG